MHIFKSYIYVWQWLHGQYADNSPQYEPIIPIFEQISRLVHCLIEVFVNIKLKESFKHYKNA